MPSATLTTDPKRLASREYQREWKRIRRANETPEQRIRRLEQMKRSVAKHKDRRRQDKIEWEQRQDPIKRAEYFRWQTIKRKYGMTKEQYEAMVAIGNGKCWICQRPDRTGKYKKLDVDHCHGGGGVRGLLCIKCNHALAVFGDDVAGLTRALAYVRGELTIQRGSIGGSGTALHTARRTASG